MWRFVSSSCARIAHRTGLLLYNFKNFRYSSWSWMYNNFFFCSPSFIVPTRSNLFYLLHLYGVSIWWMMRIMKTVRIPSGCSYTCRCVDIHKQKWILKWTHNDGVVWLTTGASQFPHAETCCTAGYLRKICSILYACMHTHVSVIYRPESDV